MALCLRRILSSTCPGPRNVAYWQLSSRFFTRRYTVAIEESLAKILPSNAIGTSQAIREQHGRDESYNQCQPPDIVIFPEHLDHVVACMRVCNQHRVPIIPFGTGTGMEGGVTATAGGVCFDLSKLAEVTDFHPDDFDVTVQPGVTRKQLNGYIRDSGLWFPIDPGADASVCGMAATSASGTNAVRYGTMRENVLNLQVVLASGDVIHTAGQGRRARKTSAGYNLTNLFVGSEGTLGIITGVTVRLHGIPETMLSAVVQFPDVRSAVDASVGIMQSGVPIARIEFLDDVQMRLCRQHSGLQYPSLPTLFLEFHGSPSAVQEQAQIAKDVACDVGGTDFQWATEPEERARLWAARHDVLYSGMTARPGSKALITDVCVPLSHLTRVISDTKRAIEESGLLGPIVGHVGDGNFHVNLYIYEDNADEVAAAQRLAKDMAMLALSLDGTCTGEHGVGLGKRALLRHEMGSDVIAVMRSIKQTLDPHGVMNPGKVFE